MFHSDCPLDADPRRIGYLRLVASEVAKFLDARGIGNDHANELFAVGQVELAKYLQLVRTPDGTMVPDPERKLLVKPVEYVRTCIENAILEYWQKDRCVFIPPSTRRDMTNRLVEKTGDWWAEPDDPMNHQWDDVFSAKTEALHPVNRESGVASGVQPHWQQPVAPLSHFESRRKVVETLAFLYSLCRDQIDRDIVDLRFLNLRSIPADAEIDGDDELLMSEVTELLGISDAEVKHRLDHVDELLDNDGPIQPANIADVAEQLGLSVSVVSERLKLLEQRYYRMLEVRLPTKRRTQRPRVRTSLAS